MASTSSVTLDQLRENDILTSAPDDAEDRESRVEHTSQSDAPTLEDGDGMDEDEDLESVEDMLMPDPIPSDDALRCSECAWEVVDNFCQNSSCGLEHNDYDVGSFASLVRHRLCFPRETIHMIQIRTR